MMYIRNPNEDRTWEAYIENVLSADSINEIEKYIQTHGLEEAGTMGHGDEQSIRKTNIRFIEINDSTEKFYDEINNLVNHVNVGKFNWQISSIEPLQYSEYEQGGHYTWHSDCILKGANNNTRKISFSILLNDPKDFEGGDLQLFKFGDEPDTMQMKKNSVVFFPSFLLHRVTPVTKGTRKALVGWVHGPNFI